MGTGNCREQRASYKKELKIKSNQMYLCENDKNIVCFIGLHDLNWFRKNWKKPLLKKEETSRNSTDKGIRCPEQTDMQPMPNILRNVNMKSTIMLKLEI